MTCKYLLQLPFKPMGVEAGTTKKRKEKKKVSSLNEDIKSKIFAVWNPWGDAFRGINRTGSPGEIFSFMVVQEKDASSLNQEGNITPARKPSHPVFFEMNWGALKRSFFKAALQRVWLQPWYFSSLQLFVARMCKNWCFLPASHQLMKWYKETFIFPILMEEENEHKSESY